MAARDLTLAGAAALALSGCAAMNDLYRADEVVKSPRGRNDGLPHERIAAVNLSHSPYCELVVRAQGGELAPPAARGSPRNPRTCRGPDAAERDTEPRLDPNAKMTKEEARNLLQSLLIKRSERICETHKGAIVSYSAGANLSLTLISAALGTAGALATGGTTQVLSGLSALAGTSRAGIQEDVFHKLLAPAVVKQINQDRTEYLDKISPNREKSVSQYNVADAVADVMRYHDRCSFYSGLASLTEKAGKVPSRAEVMNAEMAELQQQLDKSLARVKELQGQIGSGNDALVRGQLRIEFQTQGLLRMRIRSLSGLIVGVVTPR
jgi:hypothetical protein